jgi:hypothetical protein
MFKTHSSIWLKSQFEFYNLYQSFLKLLMVNILQNNQKLTNDSQRSKHVPGYAFLVSHGILRGTTHLSIFNLSSVII